MKRLNMASISGKLCTGIFFLIKLKEVDASSIYVFRTTLVINDGTGFEYVSVFDVVYKHKLMFTLQGIVTHS